MPDATRVSGSVQVYGEDVGTVSTQLDPASGLPETYTIDPDATGPAAPFTLDSAELGVLDSDLLAF